eukprot:UN26175
MQSVWSVEDVCNGLKKIGLNQFANAFKDCDNLKKNFTKLNLEKSDEGAKDVDPITYVPTRIPTPTGKDEKEFKCKKDNKGRTI